MKQACAMMLLLGLVLGGIGGWFGRGLFDHGIPTDISRGQFPAVSNKVNLLQVIDIGR